MGEVTPLRARDAPERLGFRLFGTFSVRRISDEADMTPRTRKARALLAYLLIEKGPVDRDRLAGLLWSERGEAQARASLRQCVFELRESSPELGEMLRSERQQVTLQAGGALVDVELMLALAAQQDVEGLASCFTGAGTTLLEDLDGTDPAFDQWLRTTRSSRVEAVLKAAQTCCRTALENGGAEPAFRLVRSLQMIDPLDEGLARLAMEAAGKVGQHDHVRRIYMQLVRDLDAELGIGPSLETRALHDRLIARSGAAGSDSSSAGETPTLRSSDDEGAAGPRPLPAKRWWRRPPRWTAALALLLLLVLSATFVVRDGFRGGSSPVSIAVLPFRNLSGGDDFFAEGISEDVLGQLAREPQFRVAGRTSAWSYRDRNADFTEIGRRLDVNYVLDGSVRRGGDQVRIDLALVDTRNGTRIWSQRFEGSEDRIFEIQQQIFSEVASRLRRQLIRVPQPAGPLTTRGDVYVLYLEARSLLREREPAKREAAVLLLRRAVELDPDYAPAWAALAVPAAQMQWEPNQSPEGRRAAKAEGILYARRALQLAPDLADGHAAIGELLFPDDERALSHLERASRLDPSNVDIWLMLSFARARALDFDGALDASRRAAAIDPLWAGAFNYPRLAAQMGRFAEAERFYQRAIRSQPDPYHRELLLADRAAMHMDWSGAALHSRQALRISRPDLRQEAVGRVVGSLMRLGFAQEASRYSPFVTQQMEDVSSGRAPPLASLEAQFRDPKEFWFPNGAAPIPFMLMTSGRSDDLLSFYDRAYPNPETMAADARRRMNGGINFVHNAPLIAVALMREGRNSEAERMLDLADRMIRAATRRGEVPFPIRWPAVWVWSLQQKRTAAEAMLESIDRGGGGRLPLYLNPRFRWADHPTLGQLQRHPTIRRMDAAMQARLTQERRELQAAWGQFGPP